MRKIEFRCWIPKRKEYKELVSITFQYPGKSSVCISEKGTNYSRLFADEVILEQNTGIKDKNGIYIFEGDILKNVVDNKKYTIVWLDTTARFALEDDISIIYFAFLNLGNFEIIGNIHEEVNK